MTFTLPQLLQIFLAFCGAVVSIGGAWTVLKKLREPEAERDKTLKVHGEVLDNYNKRLSELEDSNKVLMQAILALMGHEIDGDHTEQLRKAKDDLERYLISR